MSFWCNPLIYIIQYFQLFWTVAKSAIIKRTPADPTPVPENPNPLPTIPQPNPNPIPGPKHNPEPFPKPKPEPKPKYGGEWPPPTGKIPGTTPKLQEPPTGYPGNTGSKVKMPRYQ